MGSFLKKIITKRVRLHLEFHTGHDAALVRELQEYGISPERMHQVLGGQYTDDMFMAWLKRREIVEKRQAQQVAAPLDMESEVAVLQVVVSRIKGKSLRSDKHNRLLHYINRKSEVSVRLVLGSSEGANENAN
jgi:23S rRNA pseudoU1915 N3-methylase RlmH